MPDSLHPYDTLTPDLMLDAIESVGFTPDGGMLALNSYENRVYQIGIDGDQPVVAKFYRPGRWSQEAILEEHQFSQTLQDQEVPVIAPIRNDQGKSLFEYEGFKFALFPRRGGRWPELDNLDNLEWIGRFIGRIHQVGAAKNFEHRPELTAQRLGDESVAYLVEEKFLPIESARAYEAVTTELLTLIHQAFDEVKPRSIRLHGDCHPGNILWTDNGPHFVDMDDCCNGPAIQDLWMLLSGERSERTIQMDAIKYGYETFQPLNLTELKLIEPLRTLRMMHYAAWLARRWSDPAFPKAFPWFNTQNYWQDHISQLQNQVTALQEPSLVLY